MSEPTRSEYNRLRAAAHKAMIALEDWRGGREFRHDGLVRHLRDCIFPQKSRKHEKRTAEGAEKAAIEAENRGEPDIADMFRQIASMRG